MPSMEADAARDAPRRAECRLILLEPLRSSPVRETLKIAVRRLVLAAICVWPCVVIGTGCTTMALRRPLPRSGPHGVYLTWQRDPTTTMSIHWLSRGESGVGAIAWTPRDEDTWRAETATSHALPHSNRVVHSVELTGLDPDRDYRFRIEGAAAIHAFRTMPADASEPITFVAGGDVYKETFDKKMYVEAAARDPMFALIGGDIAYDNGEPSRVKRWFHWLDAWDEYMVTSDGRLIPMVVAIGNHEVLGRYDQTPAEAPFFYSLFKWPGETGCNVLDFGDYMSVIVLDSTHTHPIAGAQTEWLDRTLADRVRTPHLIVVYHVPAYPSVRRYDGPICASIREHWVPLFEQYGVDVVFENHDHAYKRTPLIRNGRVDPDGVLYLGDGAWGANIRKVHVPENTWYLDRAVSVRHVIVTTIHGDERRHEAVNEYGEVFDSYP